MRYLYNILIMALLICLTACQDIFEREDFNEDDGLELYAGSGRKYVVKAETTPSRDFSEGVLFHIFGTESEELDGSGDVVTTENWGTNYMRAASGQSSGIIRGVASSESESERRKIISKDQSDAITSVFQTNPMNLYGISVVCVDNHATEETAGEIQKHNAQLEAYHDAAENTGGVPRYFVSYSETADAATPVATPNLPDILWASLKGLTPRNNAGKVVMPFKHTLSKLNFCAVLGTDIDDTIEKIEIVELSLTDYEDGILSMADGLYTRAAAARNHTKTPDIVEKVVETGIENHFGSCMIFPTTGATYSAPGRDSGEDSGVAPSEDHAVYVDLKVNIIRSAGASGPSGEVTFENVKLAHMGETATFHPNCEYFITFTLTTNTAIVTVRPEYYEYIPEPEELLDNQIGEPVDFGGVMWATANLGATSSNPTLNALEWEKSRGFYYQYGRNIPYYVRGSVLDPHPDVAVYDNYPPSTTPPTGVNVDAYYWDYNTPQNLYDSQYAIANNLKNYSTPFGNIASWGTITHGARPFPYIPALWEKEIEEAGGDIDKGYRNFLAKTRTYTRNLKYTYNGTTRTGNGQATPDINYSDVNDALYELGQTAADRKLNRFAFSTYVNGNDSRYWNEKDYNTPSQITKNWTWGANNESQPCPKGWRVPSIEEFKSIFPISEATGDLAFNKTSATTNAAYINAPHSNWIKAGNTYWVEPVDKDYNEKKAIYVGIYRDGNGLSDIETSSSYGAGDAQGWGSIFAIKQMHTPDAYAIRWQVETVDYDKKSNSRYNGIEPVQQNLDSKGKIGRSVLVISKYDLEDSYPLVNPSGGRTVISAVDPSKICLLQHKLIENYDVANPGKEYDCIGFVDDNKNGKCDGDEPNTKFIIDWNRPSGQLYLPIPGYILTISSGLSFIYPGTEAVYWASDFITTSNGNQHGTSVRIKNAGDIGTRFILIYNNARETLPAVEKAANGGNIRCVRDTEAVN